MRGRRTAALYGLVFSVLAAGLSLAPAAPADEALDDLLTAFQLTPLGDQKPTPFTLDSIDGKPIPEFFSLEDVLDDHVGGQVTLEIQRGKETSQHALAVRERR